MALVVVEIDGVLSLTVVCTKRYICNLPSEWLSIYDVMYRYQGCIILSQRVNNHARLQHRCVQECLIQDEECFGSLKGELKLINHTMTISS
jgi:hypothetical protein